MYPFPLVDIMGLGPNYMLSPVRQFHPYIPPPLFYDPAHYASVIIEYANIYIVFVYLIQSENLQ